MTTKKSVFDTLNNINVNKDTKNKGNFTYLSWPFAWGELQREYPSSSYEFLPLIIYPDTTCEVSVNVTINEVTRNMILPVMDNRNNPIKNPHARHISDARMRCFVKCIAMFGLGLYIYAGEDLPQNDKALIEAAASKIFRFFEDGDSPGVCETWGELDQGEKEAVWRKLPNDIHDGLRIILEGEDNE